MLSNKVEPKKVAVKAEPKFTDIIHEVRDGKLFDVYMNGDKEVKAELAREE